MGSVEGKDKNTPMRIGDLAKRAGMTMRTIRYYEQRGLIGPARRTRGGFRLFRDDTLRKLRLIKNLQGLDMALDQVKAFFDTRRSGAAAAEIAPALQEVLRGQLRDVERRMDQFRAMRESIRDTLAILDSCSRCPHEPGPSVCSQCPVLAARGDVPPHMHAVIESGRHDPAGAEERLSNVSTRA
jgi:DNA-binding transcriptional MerR regulator